MTIRVSSAGPNTRGSATFRSSANRSLHQIGGSATGFRRLAPPSEAYSLATKAGGQQFEAGSVAREFLQDLFTVVVVERAGR
jgi:hypothetical protein